MKILLILSVILCASFAWNLEERISNQPTADKIFVGARIWTGDPALPWAEALAVKGEFLTAVGTQSEVLAAKDANTKVIDLNGNFIVPGFNDAHLHFLVRDQVLIEEADGLEKMQQRISEFAGTHPEAPWILGRGWGYASFPDKIPHRKYLDAALADRPVIIEERDGHMVLVNSKALEIAKITRNTPDPEHGRIVKDANGEPTGELQEHAVDLVWTFIPAAGEQENYATLKRLLDRAASYGLTSVQNASMNEDSLPVYERAVSEGAFKIRFYWAVPFERDADAKDFNYYHSLSQKFPKRLMKFGAAKGMLDGVVDAQTAAMFEPYTTGKNGIAMWKQDDLNRTAALYDKQGYQIMLHAIGDKAISMALDAYEYVARKNGARDRRDRVEHVEVPRLIDIPRFKQLGVIASTQALFANPDKTTLENYVPLIGPQRASRANAFKLFDDAGVRQAFGSDWPVFSMEVLRGIYCAATRKTPAGTPADGFHAENRIPVEAALRHFTSDAAYASFDETVKGTLTAGKYADFVVLSENILNPPAERILKTRVLMTVMGGKTTYQAK